MAFTITNPDHDKSPYTGMTREHWLDSGQFLLDGVFQHLENANDPIVLPKQHEVSYPKPDDPAWRFKAAEYEGLARTFMVASPVIAARPDLELNGFAVRDYYANQILRATDPQSPNYLWTISELIQEYGTGHYQHTVEGAALVIGLMNCRAQIWDQYSQKEKDQIAAFLTDYAHNRTIGHNWRYFNVLMLSFLKLEGYPIDEVALTDHMQNLLSQYVGDGWYRDDHFDYYIPWAHHFYGPIWCSWYGYEHEPEIARIIEKRHAEFMRTYPLMFSRQAHQFMWGRSIIYRCAASAAFGAAFLLKETSIEPGLARRIASGNLLQFLTRDDVFYKGIPCLGYYGPFEPLVQYYSCAASPFWLAKIYVALSAAPDSPFWTEKEVAGHWEQVEEQRQTVTLPSPGLLIGADGKTGTAELRPGKVINSVAYYNRLVYNTDFLWEDNAPEGATAMNYAVREYGSDAEFTIAKAIGFIREEGGVLYRQLNFGKPGFFGPARIDLADVLIPGGMIRVDRPRFPIKHELHLAHFGLPHLDGKAAEVRTLEIGGHPAITASIGDRQVALVALAGWDGVDSMTHQHRNPEADESTVIYAKRSREKDYPGMEPLVTLMLHRVDGQGWSDEELDLVAQIDTIPWTATDQPCGVKLTLKNGETFSIDFGNVEGDTAYTATF